MNFLHETEKTFQSRMLTFLRKSSLVLFLPTIFINTHHSWPTTFSYTPASPVAHQYLRMVFWCPSNAAFFLLRHLIEDTLVNWLYGKIHGRSLLNKCLVLLFWDALSLITFSGITNLAWISSSYWWHIWRCSGEAVLLQNTINRYRYVFTLYPNYSVPAICQGNSEISC